MYPRLIKDEKYFANLEGKRPPVPGKEDDFEAQCSNHKDQLNTLLPLKSITNNHTLYDHNLFKKCSNNLDGINKRENGVGETCDESAEIRNLSSNPTSIHSLSNSSCFNKIECCDDDISHLFLSPSKSNTPTTCLRWTEGLNSLLEDVEGLGLFRKFLEGELSGSSKVLDFVFSCRGLQLINESNRGKLVEVVRLIHKRYILKEVGTRLDSEVKKRVADKIKKVVGGCGSENVKEVFVEALKEVEMFLEKEMYPLFLKSDSFLDFFQKESEEIFNNNHPIVNDEVTILLKHGTKGNEIRNSQNYETHNHYSGTKDQYCNNKDHGEEEGWVEGQRKPPPSPKLEESTSVIFGSSLPSLPEERELDLTFDPTKQTHNLIGNSESSKLEDSHSINVLHLSSLSLLATRRTRQKQAEFSLINPFPYPPIRGKPSNPYHVSYAPGSAQDSELQSLSSDALTEDTLSVTDSSLDGRLDMYMTRSQSVSAYKKHARYVRHFAAKNHEANFPGRFIPRTECVPPGCNLPSTNPQAFASILIGKLQVVKENQEKVERIVKIMQGIQNSENTGSPKDSPTHHHYHHQAPRSHHRNKQSHNHHLSTKHNVNLCDSMVGDEEPDSAQSILDDHVSQLWNSFGNSPNRFTPDLATPEGLKEIGDGSFHHHPSYVNQYSIQYSDQSCRGGLNGLHCNALNRHVDKAVSNGQNKINIINSNNLSISTNSSESSSFQKTQQSSTVKYSRMSPCRPTVASKDVNHVAGWPFCGSGDQNLMSSSTHQPNLCQVFGQIKNKHQHVRLPPTKMNLSNDNPERLVNLKIQSSQSAFDRNVVTNHRKHTTLNSSFSFDAMPHEIIKNKRVGKKCGLSKGPSGTSNTKICKPAPDPNMIKGQTTRSKSLDRNKIITTNKFNQSSTSECNPNSMKYACQGNMARENIFDVSKLHPLSLLTPPPSQNKSKIQTIQSAVQSSHCVKTTKASQVNTIVGYYMQNEPIPYRIILPGQFVTLGQLKTAISKRENYRFFFKKLCSDFDTEVVHEEISIDDQVLPLWDGKVICHIEKLD